MQTHQVAVIGWRSALRLPSPNDCRVGVIGWWVCATLDLTLQLSKKIMAELGVNIDHVATVRQARRTYEPDPVWAAALCELGGADCITIHLREDRRHIQDRDLRILRQTVTVKLNLEMACESEVLPIACEVKPDQVTLVPERREELTTEGGLDIVAQRQKAVEAIRRLTDAGISVSLFLDPDPRQLEVAAALKVAAVELHTGQYALRGVDSSRKKNWKNSRRQGDSSVRPGWPCTPATG